MPRAPIAAIACALLLLAPIDWHEWLLMVAIWAMVPLSLGLIDVESGQSNTNNSTSEESPESTGLRWLKLAWWGAAPMATAAMLSPPPASVASAAVWGAFGMAGGLLGLFRLLQRPSLFPVEELAFDVGLGFWAVGAGWWMLAMWPQNPTGYAPIIVDLTAIHFHVGGLTIGVILGALGRRLGPGQTRRRRVLGASLVCYVLGFVGIAAGISGLAPLQLAGSLFLTLAVVLLAVLLGHRARRAYTTHDARLAAALLALASLAVPVGLALACWYAFGQWPGPPTITIQTMIHTHGFINALGFALPALVGLTLLPE